MALEMPACASCGHQTFPPKLLCARCGSGDWTALPVDGGTLEQVSAVLRSLGGAPQDPPRVGRVRTASGVPVIARVEGGARPGDAVALDVLDGAIVARPAAQ